MSFQHEESEVASLRVDLDGRKRVPVLDRQMDDFEDLAEKLRSYGFSDDIASVLRKGIREVLVLIRSFRGSLGDHR
ncbi:hypothetical protein Syun_022885 [Stephania yunnanensis]|uniref:Uncharacterized protein n=1 Tax=Stephania yunnanensis TaxID=152371 RepID=A0AAP0I3G6_9MAGN